ncbi:ATP-binding cassette domain-containing protein [Phytoactinopolyspora mesophila]|uniref:ATP-binding cassette domain-containing protein n=1 Tax=Phytoactinopolyspora mesophila TaxID=2650750 RepID=A0A7K3LXP1_9ACTN|nr:ATP-binding cassette domain-containing protein [Phytoactinopolyspora mesophila]NDL55804.1 ATP-binding cassette domain-containing protein [Phytoactinopolyspora mesophila]
MTPTAPALQLEHVSKDFRFGSLFSRAVHHAVVDVNLHLERCHVLGVVGESGSGKSTLGRIAVGLIPPTSGTVTVAGERLDNLDAGALRRKRRQMQMIFQDSSSSLNPRMTLQDLLMEPFRVQGLLTEPDRRRRASELADEVQLAQAFLPRMPHEFSGGQRQRISIARALALDPGLIVADEPVSALDVSVQAAILNLLKDIQEARDLSMLFISHDMAVIEFMSDDVAVIYQGRIVEHAACQEVFAKPRNDYTKLLLTSTPSL